MRAHKQLVNGEYVVPNLKCYLNIIIIIIIIIIMIIVWLLCVGFVAVLWGTDLMEDSDSSRERYLRNLLREMLTYFSFLIITCICK